MAKLAPGRDRSVKKALGSLQHQIKQSRVLMVGAGGIGCELLKNLVLTGFGEVHIVDLDTIDLSNLNRQFLFGMQHIKKSKALVAKETASKFNPNVSLIADHANIKDPKFNVEWFKTFALVFNALDNLEARRHVNKMCLAADVPLIESGTTGFNGQVQVIARSVTECYDCTTKPVPKSFPVCTIRSTPSQPIHCIVWAKSYLFNELFGVSEDGNTEFDHSEDVENAQEIEKLKQEAEELKRIRQSMGKPEFAKNVFDKVFTRDIVRLSEMEDMWKTRKPPTPLQFGALYEDADDSSKTVKTDQQVWNPRENLMVFVGSLERLSEKVMHLKATNQNSELSFDKDDDDILDFVAASANIRSQIFGIEQQSKFDIKQMAGNIIPAIATTNAITAGLCVVQALKVLRKKLEEARMVFISMSADRGLITEPLHPPNPSCQVCGVARVDFECDVEQTKLEHLVQNILQRLFGYGPSLSIIHEKLIYDEDYDDNLGIPLSKLCVKNGSFLTVTDESEDSESPPKINLIVQIKDITHRELSTPFVHPETFEIPRRQPHPPSLESLVLNGKDSNGTDDVTGNNPQSRKRKAADALESVSTEEESFKKLKPTSDVIVIDDGVIELD